MLNVDYLPVGIGKILKDQLCVIHAMFAVASRFVSVCLSFWNIM